MRRALALSFVTAAVLSASSEAALAKKKLNGGQVRQALAARQADAVKSLELFHPENERWIAYRAVLSRPDVPLNKKLFYHAAVDRELLTAAFGRIKELRTEKKQDLLSQVAWYRFDLKKLIGRTYDQMDGAVREHEKRFTALEASFRSGRGPNVNKVFWDAITSVVATTSLAEGPAISMAVEIAKSFPF